MATSRIPKLCRHRSRNQGYVTLDGREHYLGHWPGRRPPADVRARYDELIASWLANGKRLPPESTPVTANDLILAYLKWAEAPLRTPPEEGRPEPLHPVRPEGGPAGFRPHPGRRVRAEAVAGRPAGHDRTGLEPEYDQRPSGPGPPDVQVGGRRGVGPRRRVPRPAGRRGRPPGHARGPGGRTDPPGDGGDRRGHAPLHDTHRPGDGPGPVAHRHAPRRGLPTTGRGHRQ